jgi:putative aldouronate transport system permease protein
LDTLDTSLQSKTSIKPKQYNSSKLWKKIKYQKYLLAVAVICSIWIFIFAYLPLYGILYAFKEFDFAYGFAKSPWVGLAQFKEFFFGSDFLTLIKNTLTISILKLVIGFPAPIIFALLLNEIKNRSSKRIFQSISYLPYFISWVVVAGLVKSFLLMDGTVNSVLISLHIIDEPYQFLGKEGFFYPLIILSDLWKNVGWNSILYLAAIANIDPQLYEAATIDGATKMQQIRHITLPGIETTITVLLLFSLAAIFGGNFEQIMLFSQNNVAYQQLADTLDIYVYRMGLRAGRYSFAIAAGLFTSVVSFTLMMVTNKLSKIIRGYGIV